MKAAEEPSGVSGEAAVPVVDRRWRAWLVFGLATFFAFPHEIPMPGDSTVVDLGLLLAWLVPAALVVGGSGYLGQFLIRAFLERVAPNR